MIHVQNKRVGKKIIKMVMTTCDNHLPYVAHIDNLQYLSILPREIQATL